MYRDFLSEQHLLVTTTTNYSEAVKTGLRCAIKFGVGTNIHGQRGKWYHRL